MEKEPPGPAPVVVVYNCDFLEGGSAESTHGSEAGQESAEVAELIAETLRKSGRDVTLRSLDESLPSWRPNGVVFNLVESLGGDPGREAEFPRFLEGLGLPFTGNSSAALDLAHAKHEARQVLAAAGVRIPRGLVFGDAQFDARELAQMDFPIFLKPALFDGSVGIDQGSIVHNLVELRTRLIWLSDRIPGPYLAETYLPGREFNVAIGPHSLGRFAAVTEIDFSSFGDDLARIVTYDCKWIPDCAEAGACSRPVHRSSNPSLFDALVTQAQLAMRAIGAHSYGRVDLRLSAEGVPHVIDVNPNPDIHPDAGYMIATRSLGFSASQLYLGILEDATMAGSEESIAW